LKCYLCPNLCGADRARGERGLCLAPGEMLIARIAPHFYEEPPISGTGGSGTVFFSGCTMRCSYCQNFEISREPKGRIFTPRGLSEEIRKLGDQGVHNINFVTPTHYTDGIKATLDIYKPKIPVVWNTSGYERAEIIKGLKDYVEIFLPDYKYADGRLAGELSGRPNYPETAATAIAEMRALAKDEFGEGGIMKSGMIIRHLVLPGRLENSKAVLKEISGRFPNSCISLMSQYTPVGGGPDRKLKPLEYKIIVSFAAELGMEKVFVQELEAADEKYVPDFKVKSEKGKGKSEG